jgi:hypothetical protein
MKMVDVGYILTTSGITTSILGGYFGAKGYFSETRKDLYNRTLLYFYNETHFCSMLHQKYNEIFGFSLIALGSFMQLIQAVFKFDNLNINIAKTHYQIVLVIFVFLIAFTLSKIINYIAELELKKTRIPEEIIDYLKHRDDKSEGNRTNAFNSLEKIAERLKIEKRIQYTGNIERAEYIIEQGKKFCRRYKITIQYDE